MNAAQPSESPVVGGVRVGSTALLAASLAWAAGSSLYLIWRDDLSDDVRPIIFPGIIGVMAGCVCLISAAVWGRSRLVVLMAGTIAATAMLAGAWLSFLWFVLPQDGPSTMLWWKVLGTGTLALAGVVVTGQMIAPRTEFMLTLARAAAIVVADGFLVAMIVLIWTTRAWRQHGELFGLGATIWGTGALVSVWAVASAIRTSKRREQSGGESLPQRVTLRFACPRCAVEQSAETGMHKCASCGMRLLIEIEEPRCECGYLLYQLAGDTCPECGRAINEENRWPSDAAKPSV